MELDIAYCLLALGIAVFTVEILPLWCDWLFDWIDENFPPEE